MVFLLLVLSFGGIVIDRLSAAIIVVRKTTRDSLTHIDLISMRPMKRSRKKKHYLEVDSILKKGTHALPYSDNQMIDVFCANNNRARHLILPK